MRAAFSHFWISIPAIWLYALLILAILGVISGHIMVNTVSEPALHDTYYVVAHYYYLAQMGAAFVTFAILYLFFRKIFRVDYNRVLAVLQFGLFFTGVILTFVPQFFLAMQGMPKRYVAYPEFFYAWNKLASIGAVLTALGTAAFLIVVMEALVVRRKIGDRSAK